MTVIVQPLESELSASGDKGARRYKSTYRVLDTVREDLSPYQAGRYVQKNHGGNSPSCDHGEIYKWHGFTDKYVAAAPIAAAKLEKPKWRNPQGLDRSWIVVINHSNVDSERCKDSARDDPLSEPWSYSADSEEFSVKSLLDRHGQPILSTSFEPVAVDRFITRPKMRLQKNFPVHNEALNKDNEQKVNNAPVTIAGVTYPARSLYMRKISWQNAFYGTCNAYYPHTFHIDTYQDPQILNEGLMQLDPDLAALAANRKPENMVKQSDVNGAKPGIRLPIDDMAEPVTGAPPTLYFLDNGTAAGTIAEASTTGRLQQVAECDFSVYGFPAIL